MEFFNISRDLLDDVDIPLELVVNGNFVNFNKMLKHMDKKGELNRLVMGSDSPTGQASIARSNEPLYRKGIFPQ